MRIVVLGGTKFIGRAITRQLADRGHRVLVVHRGETEPADLPPVEHLHVERADLSTKRAEIERFGPDAAVEVYAMNAAESEAALAVLPDDIRTVAISSGDVYRAYDGLHSDRQTDTLPLTETSPLRTRRFIDGPRYENLEMEEFFSTRDATILRLGMVYGPHDGQRRFESVLRRIRAGRKRIPIGSANFLFSKVFVEDVATAVDLALKTPAARGEAFNVVERQTAGFRLFFEQVLKAAEASDVELVEVPDTALPDDLAITGAIRQHLQMDSAKARSALGWAETDPEDALRRSVQWHLSNPPAEWSDDFTADDEALAARL